jgi:hypothetical protein
MRLLAVSKLRTPAVLLMIISALGVVVACASSSRAVGRRPCDLLSAADVRAVTGHDVSAGKPVISESGPNYPTGCSFSASSPRAALSVELWAVHDGAAAMYAGVRSGTAGPSPLSRGYPRSSAFSLGQPAQQSTVMLKSGEYVNVLVWGTTDLPHDTRFSDALADRIAARLH